MGKLTFNLSGGKIAPTKVNTKIAVGGESVAANELIAETVVRNSVTAKASSRLDSLEDIVEGVGAASGMTLVYDQEQDKYILDYQDLDGGTF